MTCRRKHIVLEGFIRDFIKEIAEGTEETFTKIVNVMLAMYIGNKLNAMYEIDFKYKFNSKEFLAINNATKAERTQIIKDILFYSRQAVEVKKSGKHKPKFTIST